MIQNIIAAAAILAHSSIGGTVYDTIFDSNGTPVSDLAWSLDGNATTGLKSLGTTTAQDIQLIRNSLPIVYVSSYGFSMIGDATLGKQIRFNEGTNNGTNYIALRAPASVAADTIFTLPNAASSGVLTSDGSGNLTIGSITSSAWGLFGNSLVGGEAIGSTNAFDWQLIRNNLPIVTVVSDGLQVHQTTIRRNVGTSSLTIMGDSSSLGAYTTWFGLSTPNSIVMRNKAVLYEFRDGSDATWFSFENGGFFGDVVLKAPGGAAANFFRVIPQNLMSGAEMRGGTGAAAAMRVYGNSHASFPRQVHLSADTVRFRNAADNADNAAVSDNLFRFNDSTGTERAHLDASVFTSTVPFSAPQATTGERYGASSTTAAQSVAVGNTASINGSNSVVVGYAANAGAIVSTANAVIIGRNASAGSVIGQSGSNSVVIGNSSVSNQLNGIALGISAAVTNGATEHSGAAIGVSAASTHTDGWAIGRLAVSEAISTISFGSTAVPLDMKTHGNFILGENSEFVATSALLELKSFSGTPGDTFQQRFYERNANGTSFFGMRATDNMTVSYTVTWPPSGPAEDGEVLSFTTAGVASFTGPMWSLEGNSVTAPDNLLGTTNASDFSVIRNSSTIFGVTATGIQMTVGKIRTSGNDNSLILDGGDASTTSGQIELFGSANGTSPGNIHYEGDLHLFRNAAGVEQVRISPSGVAIGTTNFGSGSYVVAIKGTATTPSAVAAQGIVYVTLSGALRYRGPTTDTLLANP